MQWGVDPQDRIRGKTDKPAGQKTPAGQPMRKGGESDAEDGFAGRRRVICHSSRHSRLDCDRGSRGKRNRRYRSDGHRIHSRRFDNDRRNFAVYDAAVRFQADRGRMLAATIMICRSGRRLAGSEGQEQRGYQQNSDSRAVKHALRHVFSVALPGRDGPVMRVTRNPPWPFGASRW